MSNRVDSSIKKLELKVQAYKQRIAELTADWEDKFADNRVEYTILAGSYQEQQKELDRLREEIETLRSKTETGTADSADVSERDVFKN